MNEDGKLIDEYIESIMAKPGNTKKLFVFSFIGLNGTGKSYVTEKIAKKLDLYIASNDHIRRFLNIRGFSGESPDQLLVQKIAENSTKHLLKNRISHIIDADLIEFHGIAKKNTDEYDAKLVLVYLVCPEEVILQRLRNRSRELEINPDSNLSRVGVEKYLERKKMHESLSLPEIFFTMDTSRDVENQIDALISKLEKEQMI